MKERPIIMADSSVRAILAGRKTQTRRVVKMLPGEDGIAGGDTGNYFTLAYNTAQPGMRGPERPLPRPYGWPKDRLWVRETWYRVGGGCWPDLPHTVGPDGDVAYYAASFDRCEPQKRPSIYMPRWASRLLLDVVSVRVERLQDITEADARAEGVLPILFSSAIPCFRGLWDDINGKRPGCSWDANPFVWVVEFRRVTT